MSNAHYGSILLLNGTPRAGKSSIVRAIQECEEPLWINLGVDNYMKMIPQKAQPGIGLRPGGERPDMEPMIERLYAALYESIAAHSRLGINVVADVGHHSWYSQPIPILARCARRLAGLPALIAGIHCPIDEVMRRREQTWGQSRENGEIPAPILRWQQAVHDPGIYDIEVDTSLSSPEECAHMILQRLRDKEPLTAVGRLANLAGPLNDA